MNGETGQPAAWRDPKPVIDEMVRRIVDRFAPERIILFGSHARGGRGRTATVLVDGIDF